MIGVIGVILQILIDRTDWKIFKEDYKQIIIIKDSFLPSHACLADIQGTLGIIWKTLGLASRLSTNSQLGTKQIKRNKITFNWSNDHSRKMQACMPIVMYIYIYEMDIYVVDHEDQFNSLLKHVGWSKLTPAQTIPYSITSY